jgi:nuclear pore complex protein Nup160
MYQRGRRLAEVATLQADMMVIAEEQRQAYVIALNALGLLDEKNAWFVVHLPSTNNTQDPVCLPFREIRFVLMIA